MQITLSNLKKQAFNDTENGLYHLTKANLIYNQDSVTDIKKHLLQAYSHLEKSKQHQYYIISLKKLSSFYAEEGLKDSSIYYNTIAKDYVITAGKGKELLSDIYFNIGNQYYFNSKIDIALYNFKQSINYGLKCNDYKHVALSYKLISLIYRDQRVSNYTLYADTNLYFANKSNNSEIIADALYYKIQCLSLTDKFGEALVNINKLKEIAKKVNQNIKIELLLYKSYVFYYSEIKNFEQVYLYNKKFITLSRNTFRPTFLIGRTYNNIGDVCVTTKKYKLAINYLDTAIYFGTKFNDRVLLWHAYDNIITAYEGLNDFKTANNYFKKLNTVNDSVLRLENQTKLAEFEIKLNVEKKNLSIKNLENENELKNVLLQQKSLKQNYLLAVIFFICVLLIVAMVAYRNKQKANALLTLQKQEIIDKTEQLNKQASEIAKFRTQMNPHFIFNALNSVQGFILNENTSTALDYLNDLSKLMRTTLNNSDKEFISIKEEIVFLKSYIDFELIRFTKKFNFVVEVDENIDDENVLLPPMIIQPFIENAIKHAQLQTIDKPYIKLVFLIKDDFLQIIIEDNGCGRKQKTIEELRVHQSMGVDITKNRIAALHRKQQTTTKHYFKIIDLVDPENKAIGIQIIIILPLVQEF